MPTYIEEKKIEPMNILVIFLLGLAAALFILGAITSFNIENNETLMIVVGVVYLIAIVAFLYPKKKGIHIHTPEPEVIERKTFVEKPVVREVIKYKDRPVMKEVVKEVEKHVKDPETHQTIIEIEKVEPKKSKYMGSTYNQKYHLRTCRFSGAIKKKYLVEEDEKKYFKLRGYTPCKVCHPEKN
ncbi:MAG: hypothetical protein NUV46_02755 [Nanoarchaeota archaeon]|nr:hypothetical protein [Nanoarchaeota archaeon]